VSPVDDETTLRTERLLLRPWRPDDRAPFAALNADPRVMEWFPAPMTQAESDAAVDRIENQFRVCGWGLWAVEIPSLSDHCRSVPRTPLTLRPYLKIEGILQLGNTVYLVTE
jgi:RimJ/RimL family protein N-acetyltransferase